MSDSDDEEALQVGSKDKSRKSSKRRAAKKPVVNFMQTLGKNIPGKNIPKKIHKSSKQQHRRIPSEDDDDSEVEMLSISSGDEDSAIDQKPWPKKASGKDDDVWEGGEPIKWKHVNESEVPP